MTYRAPSTFDPKTGITLEVPECQHGTRGFCRDDLNAEDRKAADYLHEAAFDGLAGRDPQRDEVEEAERFASDIVSRSWHLSVALGEPFRLDWDIPSEIAAWRASR